MAAWFSKWSARIAIVTGYWQTFVLMAAICLVWALSGPLFRYSDTWQLVINTATTVLTFLMVFLIQNTQNRDSLAVHLKLDEVIHALENADDKLIAAEDIEDQELAELKMKYTELAQRVGISGNGTDELARAHQP